MLSYKKDTILMIMLLEQAENPIDVIFCEVESEEKQ